MFYRALRAINARYVFVALGFFTLAFFVAFFSMVYPIIPLAILFSSIYLVVLAWIGRRILVGAELALARRSLRRGRCPDCEGPVDALPQPVPVNDSARATGASLVRHACSRCDRVYSSDGAVLEAAEAGDDDRESDDLPADRVSLPHVHG